MENFNKTDLLKRIRVATAKRKIAKAEYDSLFTLSNADDSERTCKMSPKKLVSKNGKQMVRLLDEGMVTFGDGSPWFYLAKGTLQKFLDNIPDDFVGSINLGHMRYAEFPFILGTWTKESFSLVDIGDGRKGLDVELDVDKDSIYIKELKRAGNEISVSAEFSTKYNAMMSREVSDTLEDWVDVYDEINITAFAIVGDGGNVNSNGITLNSKGDTKMGLLEKYLPKKEKKDKTKPSVELSLEDISEEDIKELTNMLAEAEKAKKENADLTLALKNADKALEEAKEELKTLKAAKKEEKSEKKLNLVEQLKLMVQQSMEEDKEEQGKTEEDKDEEKEPYAEISEDGIGEV